MKSQNCNLTRTILAAGLLMIGTASAKAAHFTFFQDGFSGGGTVSGSFDAIDNDNNGWIDTWNDAGFTNFHLKFSGDSLVDDFTATWVTRLTYKLGSGAIGLRYDDTESLPASYISDASVHTTVPPFITTFTFHRFDDGAIAMDNTLGITSISTNLMQVSEANMPEVPLPGAAGLFAFGLAGLMIHGRKNFGASQSAA